MEKNYGIKLLVLAAGQGKRLRSEATQIPKVMRTALGKPLVGYVLDAADFVPAEDTWLVVGFRKEAVMEAFPDLNFVEQTERKGTGHAVLCAKEAFKDYDGDIMIINGDMPLFSKETLAGITEAHKKSGVACTMLTYTVEGEIPPFGHIIRDSEGFVCDIVEHKDATAEQKLIRELNAGLYIFSAKELFSALERLTPSTATGEYYLTALPALLKEDGFKTQAFPLKDADELLGVNTEEDLLKVEECLRNKL